jgi:cation:H+ antiporter
MERDRSDVHRAAGSEGLDGGSCRWFRSGRGDPTSMTIALLSIAAGIALLYGGAEALVRGSTSLAVRCGLTPLVVGLTVVAFGTSMPEMVVSVGAAIAENGAIAVGNVVGSNICNIALILGIAALIAPPEIHAQVVRRDMPVMVATTILIVLLLADGRLARGEGMLLATALVGYTAWIVHAARREPSAIQAEFEAAIPRAEGSTGGALLRIALGLALLVVGARLLVVGAVTVAAAVGVSEVVIGLTVVAIGTSLPELATSVVAALRGQSDIAVGNVVGSNVFNVLGILGVAAIVRPLGEVGVGPIDLAVMVGASVLLLPLMRSGFRLSRAEGACLLAGYAVYVMTLLLREP